MRHFRASRHVPKKASRFIAGLVVAGMLVFGAAACGPDSSFIVGFHDSTERGAQFARQHPEAVATCETGWNSTAAYTGVVPRRNSPPAAPETVSIETGWMSDPDSRGFDLNNWVTNPEYHIPASLFDAQGVLWTNAAYPEGFAAQRTADLTNLKKPVYYLVRITTSPIPREIVRAFALCR
jgi:hypothetical protein